MVMSWDVAREPYYGAVSSLSVQLCSPDFYVPLHLGRDLVVGSHSS